MNAIRRHHRERLRKKRLKRTAWPVERVGMYIDTPTPCSGPCCGNPRKWFGHTTLKEKKYSLTAEQAAWG